MRERFKLIALPCLFLILIFSLPLSAQQSTETKPSTIVSPITKLPDLVAEEITITAKSGGTLYAGMDAWVSCRWSRKGPQPSPFRLALDMDSTPLGPGNGTVVDHTTMGTTLNIPWTATYGWHSVRCEVDNLKTVFETNETNNAITKRVFIPKLRMTAPLAKPDLSVKELKIVTSDGSRSIKAGKEVRLSCAWELADGPAVANWRLQFTVNGVETGIASTATDDGAREAGTLSRPWIFKKPGEYKVKCILDTTKIVDEKSEKNNVEKIVVTVLP
jgi:hypothetical protein